MVTNFDFYYQSSNGILLSKGKDKLNKKEKNKSKNNVKGLGDADIKDLDKLPKNKIKEAGGEDFTQGLKKESGKSKSDLYWYKDGNIYAILKKGGASQWVGWMPRE